MSNVIASIETKGFEGDKINIGLHVITSCGYSGELTVQIDRYPFPGDNFNSLVVMAATTYIQQNWPVTVDTLTLIGGAT